MQLLADLGTKLSAEERRQFVKWREQYRPHGRRWSAGGREEVPEKGGIPTKQ